MAQFILNFSATWRWVVSITSRQLYSQEGTPYLLNRSLDGPQSQFVRFGEDTNLCLRWDSNPRPPRPFPSRHICSYTVYRHLEKSGCDLI
jgi:hypothetical protein